MRRFAARTTSWALLRRPLWRPPVMSTDPKMSPPAQTPPAARHREKGMLIFTYPKVIFIFPTMIAALVCGVGMSLIHDDTADPLKAGTTVRAAEAGQPAPGRRPSQDVRPDDAVHEPSEPDRRPVPGRLRLQPAHHGARLPPVHDHRDRPAGALRDLLHPLGRRLLRLRPDEAGPQPLREHLCGGERRVLLHVRGDPGRDVRDHLRHAVSRLLGDPAQRDPPPPRAAERPGTLSRR